MALGRAMVAATNLPEMAAPREVGMGTALWRHDEGQLAASLYRRDIQKSIARGRGIQYAEIADELGLSSQAVGHYFTDGGTEEVAGRIDDALTVLSDRHGLTPERAVWPVSGLWPDGLPDVVTTREAGYRRELTIRDLMRAPGKDL